jgi:type I restriction enzyme M protein
LIDLAHNTFIPHNNAKCVVLLLQKNTLQQQKIKIGVAVQVGHDHNGKPMYRWDYQTEKLNRNEI